MAQEVEFKFRVSDDDALRRVEVAAEGSAEGTVHQENHFFDTPDRQLNQKKAILRLRVQGEGDLERFILTAKGPAVSTDGGVLTKKAEEETSVPADMAARLLAGEQDPLVVLTESAETLATDNAKAARLRLCSFLKDASGGAPLGKLGAFKNSRTRIRAPLEDEEGALTLLLELDHTVLPGDVHQFEVEVEVPPDEHTIERARSVLGALLEKADVKWETAPPKAKRFFAALDGKIL